MKHRSRLIRAHQSYLAGEISTSEYCQINIDILADIRAERAARDKRNAECLLKLAGVKK